VKSPAVTTILRPSRRQNPSTEGFGVNETSPGRRRRRGPSGSGTLETSRDRRARRGARAR
jgi:hypothetical protein